MATACTWRCRSTRRWPGCARLPSDWPGRLTASAVPQLVLPEGLEHRVTAHALWELGVAAALETASDAALDEAVAAALAADGAPARHAATCSARLRPLAAPTATLDALLAAATRLIGPAA
jgi:hypothetical protein